MSAVRIGLIGTGYMALQAYLPGFRRQGAEIAALWGRDLAKVEALARDHAIPHAFDDFEALAASPQVDAVVLAAPNYLHDAMLRAAARAGKAVLCEKPLGLNLEQARGMLAAARQARIVHTVPFIWRLTDQSLQMKQLLEDGFLGHVYEAHLTFTVSAWATPDTSLGWRGVRAYAGEGVLADLGGHLADLVHWYVGDIVEVIGQGKTHLPERQPPDGRTENVDVIDACNVLFAAQTGTQGSLQVSYISLARPLLLRVELHGARGALVFELQMRADELSTRLGRRRLDEEALIWTDQVQPFAQVIDRMCNGFLRRLAGESGELPTMREGLAAQAVIEAVTRSLDSRCWTPVPEAA